jgi:hypothetical protein
VAVALIAFAGCGDLLQEPDTGTIPVQMELERVSGNAQEGAPEAPLPEPLRVRVLNQGEPASKLWVEWSVLAGGGEVEPRNSFSDETGLAEARWILGPSGGAQQVRAVARNGLPVIFEATVADE